MFKRRARVQFVGGEPDRVLAEALARELAAAWLEPWSGAGADLRVLLDQAADPDPADPLPRRRWPLPAAPDARRAELRRRLLGMVGGLRLLARSDPD